MTNRKAPSDGDIVRSLEEVRNKAAEILKERAEAGDVKAQQALKKHAKKIGPKDA
jgi:hypothetical protein